MDERLKDVFLKTNCLPEAGLADAVWLKLQKHNRFALYSKLTILSTIGLVSLAGLIPALRAVSSDFSQSGFFDYFSLIFSDGGAILSYWKEFSLSLLESLPTLSIILSLSLIFIFFLVLKNIMKQVGQNFNKSARLSF